MTHTAEKHLRFADRIVDKHGDGIRYAHKIGWHIWDGARWAVDQKEAVTKLVIDNVRGAYTELADYEGQEQREFLRDIRLCETASGVDGVLRLTRAMEPVSLAPTELDQHPRLFNMPGGTLDLESSAVRSHRRTEHLTKMSRGTVRVDVGDPLWEKFLTRILPDEEVRSFVQRLFGYAMYGSVTEHVMPIFTGTGANGKGTLRDAVLNAFGDYAIEVDPAILMESKHERHGTFKMQLRGARLVFCSETEKGKRFAESTMKRLVGGDPIQANYMHRDPITFDPSHTLVMLTNHLPVISGDDPAVQRRILVVPFDVVIPEDERDGHLPERLREAPDTIISWAYEGWREYQRQGLNAPEAVRVRTAEYLAESDTLGRFLGDRTSPNQHSHVRARDLYEAWSRWAAQEGEPAVTEPAFAKSMAARGFTKKRTKLGQIYPSLQLFAEETE